MVTPWRWPLSTTGRVAAGFLLFACVFFSLSHSKLVTYLLPVFPALAYVAAESWGRRWPHLPLRLRIALLLHAGDLGGRLAVVKHLCAARTPARRSRAPYARAAAAPCCTRDVTRRERISCSTKVRPWLPPHGAPLTSNYILRYRDLLRHRGQWRLYATAEEAPRVDIIVRLARRTDDAALGSDPHISGLAIHRLATGASRPRSRLARRGFVNLCAASRAWWRRTYCRRID